ncbi:MAG: PD40 domain-containing protein [Prosthecobacter sp.]|uniref:OmpA family protein n=1 Tax=Prosthecobacter sp. TaxID=1965333 RepID=UPI001A0C10AB|nr:OmpA family protein [Prosthecobacter sp.]MBE2287314.1 PD40 domain-containing protein [Prosthecobacter sp.]
MINYAGFRLAFCSISFLLASGFFSCSLAQNYSSSNKKAIRAFEEGYDLAMKRQDDKAIPKLEDAIRIDPKFGEPFALLAEIYFDQKKYELAENYYSLLIQISERKYAIYYSNLADVLMKLQRFADAALAIRNFLDKGEPRQALADKYRALLRKCDVAAFLMAHPVPFLPENLGPDINSPYSEYHPSMPADGSFLIFTVREKATSQSCRSQDGTFEDFYISYYQNGQWTPRKNLGEPVNSDCNEGAANVSPDGSRMFFAANNRLPRDESMDLFVTHRQGNNWGIPINLGPPVNTSAFESQPSFSSDGKTLYFVSNRPGGMGGNDIWITSLMHNDTWSEPINAGPTINTSANEISPFIHPDGQTLYFASDGHEGMGGYDFFVARLDLNSLKFSSPMNLGYPINTVADERSLIITADGGTGYYASTHQDGLGGYDLYRFRIHEAARPQPVSFLKGKVLDKKTRLPLQALFELIDVETGETVVSSVSDIITGSFLVSLPPNRRYALNVSKEGYLFFSESFDLSQSDSLKPQSIDIPLQPIEVGGSVVLRNVYFDTDKFDLLPDSKAELNKLVALLSANPSMKIEIGGHTDNVGSKVHNQKLSENRAKAVYDYLLSKGIVAARLTYKGYGDNTPIADNATEAGRAQNRRTEFKVMAR